MTKLGFILKTFNRILYISEVLMELLEKQKKQHTNISGFCIQIKTLLWIFPKYFLHFPYFPTHSEEFIFIISAFPSNLFFLASFSPFFPEP